MPRGGALTSSRTGRTVHGVNEPHNLQMEPTRPSVGANMSPRARGSFETLGGSDSDRTISRIDGQEETAAD